jgi:hypothetical protein
MDTSPILKNGHYLIISQSTNLCLDANIEEAKQYSKDYPRCFLSKINYTQGQRWIVLYTNETTAKGEKIYLIFSNSNQSLDGSVHPSVPNYDKSFPLPFLAEHSNEKSSQKWVLVQPGRMPADVFYIMNLETTKLLDANLSACSYFDSAHPCPFMTGKGYIINNVQSNKSFQFVPWPDIPDPIVPSGKYLIINVRSGRLLSLSESGELEMKSSTAAAANKLTDEAIGSIWQVTYLQSLNIYLLESTEKIILETDALETLTANEKDIKPRLRCVLPNQDKSTCLWRLLPSPNYEENKSVFIISIKTGKLLDASMQQVDINVGAVAPPVFAHGSTSDASATSKMWRFVAHESNQGYYKIIDLIDENE